MIMMKDLEQDVDVPTGKKNISVETLCVVGTPMCTVQYCRDSTGLKWNSAGGTFPVHLEWRQNCANTGS